MLLCQTLAYYSALLVIILISWYCNSAIFIFFGCFMSKQSTYINIPNSIKHKLYLTAKIGLKKKHIQCHETLKEISNMDTRPKSNAMFCKGGG